MELPPPADHELRGVADPPLIRAGGLEPTRQEIRCDGLIVIAHRRAFEPLPGPRFQPVFLHQTDHALAANALRFLDQILVNARAPVPLPAFIERGAHQDAEASVGLRVRRLRSIPRGIEAAGRHLQIPTQLRNGELGLLRVDPSEDYAWFLAKKAAAFFRMSRSMRNSRLSLRRAASSARFSSSIPSCPWCDLRGPGQPSCATTARSAPDREPPPPPSCPRRAPAQPPPL